MKRSVSEKIEEFSIDKFVFLPGPRQVGKTTVGEQWLKDRTGLYLNWDAGEDRQRILSPHFVSDLQAAEVKSVVLDEIHKYSRWKNLVKGLFDKHKSWLRVLVTGSARLDVFKKGGDSLFGRYELIHLHPLTMGELSHFALPRPPQNWLDISFSLPQKNIWTQLDRCSGFPEPFLKDDSDFYQRWSRRRRELIIREDLRDLTEIRNVTLVEQLLLLLPERVGSTLSINALRQILLVSHETVSSWLDALESLYLIFRISSYSQKLSRSLTKEKKVYLWDWVSIQDAGARFENMVASHLLKSVQLWNDLGYGEFDLNFYRDVDKQEVDFVLLNRRVPVALFECKLSDISPSSSLNFLGNKLNLMARYQLVATQNVDKQCGNIRVMSADKFFSVLL